MKPDLRVFGSPHRYVQGPGALSALPEWTERLGGSAVIVTDEFAWSIVGETVEKAYGGKTPPAVVPFAGEITYSSIDAAAERARPHAPRVVVGLGGGKALDVGKGVARALGARIITAPTIASNDSPTSRSFAVYDEKHVMVAVERGERNPDLVLVDSAVIARAPARYLRSGIGDAIAKKFEGEAVDQAGGLHSHGTRALRAGLVIADGCYRTIREHAVAGVRANEAGTLDESLERTIEACILLSGVGFENSGLSVAHSMTRGLMAAPATAGALHGEHVAYGLLIQLHTEGRPRAFIDDLLGFYDAVGLPRRLSALGMKKIDESQLALIAARTLSAPHMDNVPSPVDAGMLIDAIRRLEAS